MSPCKEELHVCMCVGTKEELVGCFIFIEYGDEPPGSSYFVFFCFFLELHKTTRSREVHRCLVVFFFGVVEDDNELGSSSLSCAFVS